MTRLRAAAAGCDAVVHLAAKVALGVGIADIDDLGTAVVLRAAAEAGIRRLVFASSLVVYGEGSYDCPRYGSVRPAPYRATTWPGETSRCTPRTVAPTSSRH